MSCVLVLSIQTISSISSFLSSFLPYTRSLTMATLGPEVSTPPSFSALSACSSIINRVCLYDWWLIKPDSSSNCKRLSVGGINSEERLGIRVFHSAPILKRYNDVTFETTDGITVTICGTINRSRTLQNGFTQEVCNHFLIGFPYYWEEFINQLFSEESTEGLSNLTGVVAPLDGFSTFSSGSLDELPRALLRDFSLSTLGGSANSELIKSMFGDILEKYDKRINDGGLLSSKNSKSDHKLTRNSRDKDTPTKGKKSASQQNQKCEDDLSLTETRRKKLQKTALGKRTGFESNALRKGPLTRSMAHLKNSRNKKDENVDTPDRRYKGLVTGKIVSNTTQVTRKLILRNRSVELNVQSTE